MKVYAQKQNQPQQKSSPNITRSSARPLAANHVAHPLMHLQRTIGNQAAHQMLQTHAEELAMGSTSTAASRFAHDFNRIPLHSKSPIKIQAKLTENTLGDIYEQEAGRVSGHVMNMSSPQLHRICACGGECPRCQMEQLGQEHGRLQTKRLQSGDLGQIAVPPIVHEVLRSPGQPLDPSPRAFMESRFGHDFSRVQVHSDTRAAESAEAVNALAYTAGRHLVFGAGHYSPTAAPGRRLLAHELAHSLQQGFAANPLPELVGNAGSALERQADEAADAVVNSATLPGAGNTTSMAPTVGTTLLQREEALDPNLNLPPHEEKIYVRETSTARETVPPDCTQNYLVMSWEGETCCSNRGFPDPAAKNKKAGVACCNVFPRFVDSEAIKYGFDGAASCRPKYLRHSATVTPNDKSKTAVKVICTDTRANEKDIIELGHKAALKAYGHPDLRDKARVCFGDNKEPGTCYLQTECNETTNPNESQCLPAGCSKTDAAGNTKKQDKPKKQKQRR